MNIVGCLIWFIIGVIFIFVAEKVYKPKQVNYDKYPTTDAKVIGTNEYGRQRWKAEFIDQDGVRTIAIDDQFAASTFNPKKYSLPKRGNIERVYYWRNNHRHPDTIGGVPVIYWMHFCNEDFYALGKEKDKRNRKAFWVMGILTILAGIAILLCGYN